jgi:hypothetical protein
MTPKENCNENLRKSISGIFGKKFMGTHCNALLVMECGETCIPGRMATIEYSDIGKILTVIDVKLF